MDKKLKKQWIAALTSGDYEQGQGKLCSQYYHCCLGVLCEVVRNENKRLIKTHKGHFNFNNVDMKEVLTTDMLNFVQLTDTEQKVLVDMNDSRYTFKDIAHYIEENL
jgi:hypothetical protein